MIDILQLADIDQRFFVPIFFSNNNDRSVKLTIEFTNLLTSSTYSEDVMLEKWPDIGCLSMSLKTLRWYLNPSSAQKLTNLISSIYQKSDLYSDSIHTIKITAFGLNSSVAVTRYFLIPAIAKQPTTIQNIAQLTMNGQNCDCVLSATELSLLSIETVLIANCTFSDSVIYANTYTDQSRMIRQHIDVSNYEMSELIYYAIGRTTDGSKKLLTCTTIGQTTILIPKVSILKGEKTMSSDGKRRRADYSIKIECPTFNGISFVNNGSAFYKNGIKFAVDGLNNPMIEVSRLIGAV